MKSKYYIIPGSPLDKFIAYMMCVGMALVITGVPYALYQLSKINLPW